MTALPAPWVRARDQWRQAGRLAATGLGWLLYAFGWLVRRSLLTVAAVLFAAGWLASTVVWPGMCWCGRAVRLGWRDGSRTVGRRGPA